MFCQSRSFRFITWTVLGEEYRSLSSTLHSFSTPLLPCPS
jgi:hypothetical protein